MHPYYHLEKSQETVNICDHATRLKTHCPSSLGNLCEVRCGHCSLLQLMRGLLGDVKKHRSYSQDPQLLQRAATTRGSGVCSAFLNCGDVWPQRNPLPREGAGPPRRSRSSSPECGVAFAWAGLESNFSLLFHLSRTFCNLYSHSLNQATCHDKEAFTAAGFLHHRSYYMVW